jgi:hypothetical protein
VTPVPLAAADLLPEMLMRLRLLGLSVLIRAAGMFLTLPLLHSTLDSRTCEISPCPSFGLGTNRGPRKL